MLKFNQAMRNPYQRYECYRSASVPVSTNAHCIVFVKAEDKVVDFHYIDHGGKPRNFVGTDGMSLAKIVDAHGADGFIRINRNFVVNLVAVTALFPTSQGGFAISVEGFPNILPVSRRLVTTVRKHLEGRS